ncbi:unnamed protein product [Effrenium voratum]|uniref:Tyrosine-protein phosphatase domain-containing protein n=1 Tax=Effrenium voratum TaxID=2562239 RepID=A0AA36IVL9_9DINO|nr:unnamed protein product [Effrenium voratum]
MPDEQQQSFFESLYHALDADANEIADGLFLGAAKAASDKAAMKKRKISHVLIAHPTMPEKHPNHFRYGRAPLVDIPNFNLLEMIPDALAFLREARSKGGKVFCYCAKGISRSSSLVIALLNALLLGSLPDLFLGGVSPARPNAKAEAKEVRLLDEEGSWIFLLLRGMTTVSFCRGELPITWLRDRLARLLAANPWLGGRLVRKSEAVYLSFGCDADAERHLQLLGPDVIQITADMPYELISQQVSGSPAEVRSGMDCLQNPREPLIRVSLCCEAGDRFALIVSLSHIIADGRFG